MYEVLLIKYFTPCYRINSALLIATVVSNSECQRDLFSAIHFRFSNHLLRLLIYVHIYSCLYWPLKEAFLLPRNDCVIV